MENQRIYYKVDYQKMGEPVQTAVFGCEMDRVLFLEGETVSDINEYWVTKEGARVIRIYEEE